MFWLVSATVARNGEDRRMVMGSLTVGQWLERWLAARTAPRPSTLRGYAAHVRLYLAPYLGQMLLADLSAAHVRAMFTAIVRQHAAAGQPIGLATLVRVKATLRAALNAAIRAGHMRQRHLPRRAASCTPAQGRGVDRRAD
jgi:hypothetical protein